MLDSGTTKLMPITPFFDHATQPCALMDEVNTTSKYEPVKIFVGTEMRQPASEISVAVARQRSTVGPLNTTFRRVGRRGGERSLKIERLDDMPNMSPRLAASRVLMVNSSESAAQMAVSACQLSHVISTEITSVYRSSPSDRELRLDQRPSAG